MTRIFQQTENVYNAADCIRLHGYAPIEGTKTSAMSYCERVIRALSVYKDVQARISYLNVPNNGYLYFVYDVNRYSRTEVSRLIEAVDKRSS